MTGWIFDLSFRYAEREAAIKRQAEIESNKENIEAKNAYVTEAAQNASPYILISTLYKHIADKNPAVLVIDCRSTTAYSESKIKFSNMINIPEECIRKGYAHFNTIKIKV